MIDRFPLVAVAAALLAACAQRQASAPPPPGVEAAPAASRPKVEFQPLPAAELAKVRNPHDHGGKPVCQSCHDIGDGRVPSPIAACTRCHRFAHHNHPVDVAVEEGVTPRLPLLQGGRVACHTCHDPHGARKALTLRKPFNALCLECHRKGH